MQPCLNKSVIIVFMGLTLFACTKAKNDDAKKKLAGKWKLEKTAEDDNGNYHLEASELRQWNDGVEYTNIIEFNSDETGIFINTHLDTTENIVTTTIPFLWSLINNNHEIKITYTVSNVKRIIHIHSVSTSEFISRDTSYSYSATGLSKKWLCWEVYKKQ